MILCLFCHCYFISIFGCFTQKFFEILFHLKTFINQLQLFTSQLGPLPWDQPSAASIHLTTLGQAWVRIDEATIHRTTDDLMDQGCSPL